MAARKRQYGSQAAAGGQKERYAAVGAGESAEGAGHRLVDAGTEARATVGARRWRRRGRVLVGGAACVLAAAGLLVLSGVLRLGRDEGVAQADEQLPWACTIAPKPGLPRPWEAGLQAGPYSVVNMIHRNLVNVIPIITLPGIGPDISMTLYHNAVNGRSGLPLTAGMGFSLGGKVWTTSYSAQLMGVDAVIEGAPVPEGTRLTYMSDDGRRDEFVYQSGAWASPRGVFTKLEGPIEGPTGWVYRLVAKDQSYLEFLALTGWLNRVVDELGRELTITRWAAPECSGVFPIRQIDSGGNILDFTYLVNEATCEHKLSAITDPGGGDAQESTDVPPRSWTFGYDGNGRLTQITDPMGNSIDIEYVFTGFDGLMKSITEKRASSEPERKYEFTYVSRRLTKITDPLNLEQQFADGCVSAGVGKVHYTDRQNNAWSYEYFMDTPVVATVFHGHLAAMMNPLGERTSYTFDYDRLLTQYRDGLNHLWQFTYDARGNRLTATNPLNEVSTWTYNDLNRVTSHTDPAGQVRTFAYENTEFPMLLTKITEPADGQGNGPAETVLEYYPLPLEFSGGLLKRVTDPNGVVTAFGYDGNGNVASYAEGEVPGSAGFFAYTEGYTHDVRSRMRKNQWTCSAGSVLAGGGSGGGGSINYNPLNQQTSNSCEPLADPPPIIGDPPALLAAFPNLPCSPANLPLMSANGAYEYTGFGRLKQQVATLSVGAQSFTRTHQTDFDALGSVETQGVVTNESGGNVPRPFTFNHQYAQGRSARTGPDGVETVTELDAAGRVSLVRRGPESSPVMTAAYTYHANGLAASVTYGNGTATHYLYDAAGRVTEIRHVGSTLGEFKLVYAYDVRGLPVQVEEHGNSGLAAVTGYAYDHRGRLIREVRTGGGGYDYQYAYDQGGNRTEKVDAVQARRTEYVYDVSAGVDYGTFNNRLMESREYDASGPPSEPEPLLAQVWYYYNCGGNVTRVVRNEAGSNVFTATRMEYAKNGRSVTFVLGESWTWDGNQSGCPIEYAVSYAREFRYDGARQRYLNRPLDPATLAPITDFGAAVWTDYDGDSPYGDYVVGGLDSAVDWRSYEPGIGEVGPWSGIGDANTQYHHGDHLGTLRLRTASSGAADATRVFSAFGERLAGPAEADRYGYVGAHGYQAHEEFPFLHVGARYYDPASGRFLQRDPIGIDGAFNVYQYVENVPSVLIDPEGLQSLNAATLAAQGFSAKEIAEILGIAIIPVVLPPPAPIPNVNPITPKPRDPRQRIGEYKDPSMNCGPRPKTPPINPKKEKPGGPERHPADPGDDGPPVYFTIVAPIAIGVFYAWMYKQVYRRRRAKRHARSGGKARAI